MTHSCHEFKFYEALILDDEPGSSAPPSSFPTSSASPAPTPAAAPAAPTDSDNVVISRPEELLRRAILRLANKGGEGWVLKGSIRPMMKRMDPTFEEEQHGCRSFSAFMKKFENLLEVRAGRNDQEVRLKGLGERSAPAEGERRDEGRRERDDRRRDRSERRPEAPADRSPGRVAERIARALEKTPAAGATDEAVDASVAAETPIPAVDAGTAGPESVGADAPFPEGIPEPGAETAPAGDAPVHEDPVASEMPEIEPAPAGDAEAPAEPRGAAKGKGRRPAARKPAPRAEGKAAEKPEKAAKPAKPARPRSRGRSDKG